MARSGGTSERSPAVRQPDPRRKPTRSRVGRRRFLELAVGAGAALYIIPSGLIRAQENAPPVDPERPPDAELLEDVLRKALSNGGDFAEVFLDERSRVVLEYDGAALRCLQEACSGAGVRVLDGPRVGFSSTTRTDPESLLAAGKLAAAGAISRTALPGQPLRRMNFPVHTRLPATAEGITPEDLAQIAREAAEGARRIAPNLQGLAVRLIYSLRRITVANSRGIYASDRLPFAELDVRVTLVQGGLQRVGRARRAVTRGDDLPRVLAPGSLGGLAARQARVLHEAGRVAPGERPIVFAPGAAARLLLRAVGELLCSRRDIRGRSIFAGKTGQRLATSLVTIVDDATVAGQAGSFNVDDEGVPAQRKALIERGVLKGWLFSQREAFQQRRLSTGNGRRARFDELPRSYPSNIYLQPGRESAENIIAESADAIYVAELDPGRVDPETGMFWFPVREGYRINQGEIGAPCHGVALHGAILEFLRRIDLIGNDLGFTSIHRREATLDLPVAVGNPTFRVAGLQILGAIPGAA
jgi:TldD protein